MLGGLIILSIRLPQQQNIYLVKPIKTHKHEKFNNMVII
jgi:hypothetical protein